MNSEFSDDYSTPCECNYCVGEITYDDSPPHTAQPYLENIDKEPTEEDLQNYCPKNGYYKALATVTNSLKHC